MNINESLVFDCDLPVLNLSLDVVVGNDNVLNESSNLLFEDINCNSENLTDSESDLDSVEITKDEFSFFLINMRNTLELNQSEMASKLGINKNSYNAFENGKRIPKNWSVIKDKINYLARVYVSENRGFIHKKYINEEMENTILTLHNLGKNIVQIGIEVELDEEKVYEFLVEKGLEPIEYTLNW